MLANTLHEVRDEVIKYCFTVSKLDLWLNKKKKENNHEPCDAWYY